MVIVIIFPFLRSCLREGQISTLPKALARSNLLVHSGLLFYTDRLLHAIVSGKDVTGLFAMTINVPTELWYRVTVNRGGGGKDFSGV